MIPDTCSKGESFLNEIIGSIDDIDTPLTNHKLAFLLTPAIMFASDLFLGFGNWIWFTYPALAIASFISEKMSNKYISLLYGWLVWHVMANLGQIYPPFSLEALLFDLRFLASGLGIVILYDIAQKLYGKTIRT